MQNTTATIIVQYSKEYLTRAEQRWLLKPLWVQ